MAFQTTRWSLVVSASRQSSTESRRALEALCRAYWFPLFAYIRRCGYGEDEARDLTQGFFARLLGRDDLAGLDPEKGRFRSFLLASLRHFMSDERDRENALKRRAFGEALPLDEVLENRPSLEPLEAQTPETVFERQWARRTLERAFERLHREAGDEAERRRFDQLEVYLTGGHDAPPQSVTAARLGLSEGALRAALHRLRRRFGRALRAEIADTVVDESEVDDELRHLLGLFSG